MTVHSVTSPIATRGRPARRSAGAPVRVAAHRAVLRRPLTTGLTSLLLSGCLGLTASPAAAAVPTASRGAADPTVATTPGRAGTTQAGLTDPQNRPRGRDLIAAVSSPVGPPVNVWITGYTDNGDGGGGVVELPDAMVELPDAMTAEISVGPPLGYPAAVAVDATGAVFLADTVNDDIIEIAADRRSVVTAGVGLAAPTGVAVDAAGNVFVADTGNSRVVEIPAGGGVQRTVAADLNVPQSVAVDSAGDVFVADTGHDRVVELPGGGGGEVTVAADLKAPQAVTVDVAGNVFIADTNDNRVVEVPRGQRTVRVITTDVELPSGIAVDSAGDVFIADTIGDRVLDVPAGGGAPFALTTDVAYPAAVAVAPGSPPTTPSIPTATRAGTKTAVVGFTPGATGGDPTAYTVTATDKTAAARGAQSTTAATSPVTVAGLTDGDQYIFTISAANAAGSAPATSTPSLVVGVPPTVAGHPSAGSVGHPYRFGFTVAGSPAPTVTVDTGRLPPGLALSTGGILSGTPTRAGCYQFALAALNHVGDTGTETVHLLIRHRHRHRHHRDRSHDRH